MEGSRHSLRAVKQLEVPVTPTQQLLPAACWRVALRGQCQLPGCCIRRHVRLEWRVALAPVDGQGPGVLPEHGHGRPSACCCCCCRGAGAVDQDQHTKVRVLLSQSKEIRLNRVRRSWNTGVVPFDRQHGSTAYTAAVYVFYRRKTNIKKSNACSSAVKGHPCQCTWSRVREAESACCSRALLLCLQGVLSCPGSAPVCGSAHCREPCSKSSTHKP